MTEPEAKRVRLPVQSWLIAIFVPAIPAVVLLALFLGKALNYGLVLFFVLPFFQGIASAMLLGRKCVLTRNQAINVAGLSGLAGAIGLGVAAKEGILCLIMASPLLGLAWFAGGVVGYNLLKRQWAKSSGRVLASLVFLVPGAIFAERAFGPPQFDRVVVSVTVINAPPSKVWPLVLSLSSIDADRSPLLKSGIAYPVSTQSYGEGVGARRECRLSTGIMQERIIACERERLMRFEVKETPPSMKEINPLGDVDAPHLHGYFECQQGEFKLEALPGGRTRLTGTSWYRHRFGPSWYWSMWTDAVVHDIHSLVFKEIAKRSTD